MQIPSNIFLAQLRPSVYLPACMALWGVISALTGVAQNAAGLYATRFFLGFVEAAFYREYPGRQKWLVIMCLTMIVS